MLTATVALGIALSPAGLRTDQQILNLLFRSRGTQPASEEIVLICIGEDEKNAYGLSPYTRDDYALVITGLRQLGARTIGLDFLFDEPRGQLDSALCKSAAHASDLVFARSVTEWYESDVIPEDTLAEPRRLRSSRFYEAPEIYPVLPCIEKKHGVQGHVEVTQNLGNDQFTDVPLYILHADSLISSFALQLFLNSRQLEHIEVAIEENKILIHLDEKVMESVPINDFCIYSVNFRGSLDSFKHYAFADILQVSSLLARGERITVLQDAFRGKIVLIGTLIGRDKVVTPYNTFESGIVMHASVLDNLIKKDFLKCHLLNSIVMLILMAVVIALIHWRLSGWKKECATALIVVAAMLTVFLAFYFGSFVFSTVAILIFSGAAWISLSAFDNMLAQRENKSLAQQKDELELLLVDLKRTLFFRTPFYRLIVYCLQGRERCSFPHILETHDGRDFAPFVAIREVKNPLQIASLELAKLEHHLKLIWQRYYHHLKTGAGESPVPAQMLQQMGIHIYYDFGLRTTFEALFNACDSQLPLIILLTQNRIPWHLAYCEEKKQFLCERFAIGHSFAQPRSLPESAKSIAFLAESKRTALVYYGDWLKQSDKALPHLAEHIERLRQLVSRGDVDLQLIHEDHQHFSTNLKSAELNNIRLVYYAGHVRDGYLDAGPENYIKPGMLTENFGLELQSRPLIFLNACSSGILASNWQPLDNISTEFLASGAGACIVTCFDVFEKTAALFAERFMHHFISLGMSAGEALRLTILDFGKEDGKDYNADFDITRYAYCLYGDPTINF